MKCWGSQDWYSLYLHTYLCSCKYASESLPDRRSFPFPSLLILLWWFLQDSFLPPYASCLFLSPNPDYLLRNLDPLIWSKLEQNCWKPFQYLLSASWKSFFKIHFVDFLSQLNQLFFVHVIDRLIIILLVYPFNGQRGNLDNLGALISSQY